ncbi:MAG: polysaccharide biosynthesis tyrosine autokinase [Elusimicrobia bacterium]|nr:polysaccharide biosynthesis tyrosine autokinase [Elusimicrobiota bacterium]
MDIEPSLHDYWRIVKKRKWLVVFIASVTAVGGFVYTEMQTPLYRTQGMVKYEPPGGRVLGVDTANWDQFTALKTQVRMLNSGDMAGRVSQRVGKRVKFDAAEVKDSNLVTIAANSRSAAEAADIVNAAMDIYAESDLEERSQASRKSLEDIVSRRAEVEASLNDLEEKRRDYMESHPGSGTGMGGALSSTLLDLDARRKELLKRFTPEHPEVAALDQRIESARAKLAQVPGLDLELERLSRDVKVNEELYITLSKQMEETRVALFAIPAFVTIVSRAAVPEKPFYPNRKTNNMLGCLLGVLLGLLAVFMLESLDISISTIEDIERVVGVPVLAVIPHLGTERKWDALKAKLLRRERYPIDAFRSLLLFHQSTKSPTIEAYHSLRSAISAQQPDRDHWALAFTSTGVAEGKTLTAVNFCLAAVHAGLKVLLIGSDIRRPVVHRVFGIPKQPGLMEVLTGGADWRDVQRGTVDFLMGEIDLDRLLTFSGIDNFKVMTSWAASSADIVNIFSSPLLPKFIEEVRPHFDLTVFDCPPVLLFVDAVLIGEHCDGVVMVYQSGKMARQALKRAKDQLTASNVKILGVTLNDMQSSEMGPAYSYYYGYSHYARQEES